MYQYSCRYAPINDFFCRKENSHPWPVSHRVNHDYLVEQTELEEDLFAEIEAVEDSSLESSTLVTVECKGSCHLRFSGFCPLRGGGAHWANTGS